MKLFERIIILALLLLCSAEVVAQNDSILVVGRDTIAYRYTPISAPRTFKRGEKFIKYITESSIDRSFDKRVDFSFMPGLYYSQSTSLGLAFVATGLYRLDKKNRAISPSNFNISAAASITGFYRVALSGRTIFRDDRRRIIYNVDFSSMPTNFWGVGYDAGMENAELRYLASRAVVDGRFLQRVTKGLYIGVGADFSYLFSRFGGKRYASQEEFMARLNGEKSSYTATGISLFVEYDSRNNIDAPQRGVYLSLQAKVRPRGLNSVGQTLWSGRLVADYYQRLWRGAVLAFDLRGEFNSEGTPWVYNATIGGLTSMRGYYAGRFNDLCAVTLQAELRQRLYKGLGATAWGGAGNVFHRFGDFDLSHTLPTYGVGLRYELKQGVNFRLDYGFGAKDSGGKLVHGAVFSLSEAF